MNYTNTSNSPANSRQDDNQMNRYVANPHPSYLTINNGGQVSHVTVSSGQMVTTMAQIPQPQHIQLQNYPQNSTIYQLAQVGVLPPNSFRLHNQLQSPTSSSASSSSINNNGNLTVGSSLNSAIPTSVAGGGGNGSGGGNTGRVVTSGTASTPVSASMDSSHTIHSTLSSAMPVGMNNIGVYSLSAANTNSIAPACNISNKNINLIAAALSSSLHSNNNTNANSNHLQNNEDNISFLANVIASDSNCANSTGPITALSAQPQVSAGLCGSASMLARMAGMEHVAAGAEWLLPTHTNENGSTVGENGFASMCLNPELTTFDSNANIRNNHTSFQTSAQGKYSNQGKDFRVENVFLLCPCCSKKLKLSVEIKDDKTGIELVAVNDSTYSSAAMPMLESKVPNCNLVQQARYERDSIKMVLNNSAIKNQAQLRKTATNQRPITTTLVTPLVPKNVLLIKGEPSTVGKPYVDKGTSTTQFTGPDMMNSIMDDLLIKTKTTSKKRKRGERRVLQCNNRGCDKSFETLQELNEHLQTHKSDVYACTWNECNREFSKIEELFCHFRNSHSDQSKAFKCPCCEKAFVDAKQLRNHYRLHTGKDDND